MDTTTKLTELSTEQNTLKKPSGDYAQVKRTIVDGVDYEVHEYGNPIHNYWGYQVIFHELREDGEYTKSDGFGEESKSRTWDWTKIEKL